MIYLNDTSLNDNLFIYSVWLISLPLWICTGFTVSSISSHNYVILNYPRHNVSCYVTEAYAQDT